MVSQQLATSNRLEAVERKIIEPSFRENKGLGNEVGYYVFDYPAKDELIVREWVRYCQKKNNPAIDGIHLAVFDLYDIVMDLLEQEGYLEQTFEFEKQSGMQEVINAIVDLVELDNENGYLINFIKEHTENNSVVFLVGIGKCYPFLRSHKVLNNLHQVLDHLPVIMFYPGIYDGQELVLFGSIKDDNYYRAFRLVE